MLHRRLLNVNIVIMCIKYSVSFFFIVKIISTNSLHASSRTIMQASLCRSCPNYFVLSFMISERDLLSVCKLLTEKNNSELNINVYVMPGMNNS